MKYTLILGIEYKKYKNPAVFTVSIGNKFIDTFTLEKDFPTIDRSASDIEHHWFNYANKWGVGNKTKLITRTRRKGLKKLYEKAPSFFKIYHLNDANVKGNLEVKVDNDNTDFTNGFMKNNSTLRLSNVALFPSVLGLNRGEHLIKTCLKLNKGYYKFLKRQGFDDTQDIKFPTPESSWPVQHTFYVKRANDLYEKSGTKESTWYLGGSFTAEFPIRKKHKVKYLGSSSHKERGFVWATGRESLFISSCKSLLNIYNED